MSERACTPRRQVILLAVWFSAWPAFAATPQASLKAYLQAVYARDYATAYTYISRLDTRLKTQQEYVRENGALAGAALDMARALGSLMRFENVRSEIAGDRAHIGAKLIVPNANAQAIQELLLEFDQDRLEALSPAERRQRAAELRDMATHGRLTVLIGEHEQWEMVREEGRWRIFLNWAGAVEVRFEAATGDGLPWEFTPLQDMVRAVPGETLQTFYRVRNLAERELTGKARHILTPAEDTGYLEIVSCFCFMQQTLAPGEEAKLPVLFRVSYDIPDAVRQMRVRYEFYPLDEFRNGASK